MRAVRYHDHGGPDVLEINDIESPEPDHGEVRVAVRAVGVNPVDTYFRTGEYEVPELPMVPGSDLAGEVDAVGDGVTDFDEGDRVFATGLGGGQGTYAEQVVAPVDRLAHLPSDVPFEVGAATGVVAGTAWRAFVDHADLEPAETCLVHGASGGVGHVAVQLASTMGANVVGTASEEYHDRLESLGATTMLDYTRDDLADAVTEAGTPDVILDTRADEYLQFDADVAAIGARVICIGNATEHAELTAIGAAKTKDVRFQFMTLFNTPDLSAVLDRIAALLDTGAVIPDVARTYDLDEAGEAQRAVMEDSVFGKLVLIP
jgi:NADPH2:quinone reductase